MPRPTGQGIDKDTRRVIKKTGAQFDASSRHVKQGDGEVCLARVQRHRDNTVLSQGGRVGCGYGDRFLILSLEAKEIG